jgi:hypothetical protein
LITIDHTQKFSADNMVLLTDILVTSLRYFRSTASLNIRKIEVVQTSYFTHGELELSLLLEVTSPDADRNVKSTQFLVFA